MTARERVLTVLNRGVPDRVPWLEHGIAREIQVQLMAGRTDFTPAEFCTTVGLDAFGLSFNATGPRGFMPPWIAEVRDDIEWGQAFVVRPLLTDRASLRLFDQYLPDPDDPARYEQVQDWLARTRGDHAVWAHIRLGASSTIESMGLDVAALAAYDDPSFLQEVHARFSDWCARVVEHVNQLDLDFLWVADDVADNNGPWFSPDMFRAFFLPHMREVARRIKKPWIYHSDGNIEPLLPDLLTLGMNAIHPLQPGPMDIAAVKRKWGDRVCLVGNIDLVYILTRATPAEVDENVRYTISVAAPGGGYAISSSPGLSKFCRVENIQAMAWAIRKYGRYPLTV